MDKLRSPMLDVKVVCLLVFFLLSEIGSGKTSPYKTYGALHRNSVPCSRGGAAYYSCLPEKLLDSGYCDPDEGLPCTEMFALRTFISKLGLAPAPFISRSYCSDKESLSSITIDCICNGNVCHISQIIMQNLRLDGYIHEAVAQLTHLEKLDLAYNELHGSIPVNLANLTSLTEIHLEDNQLTGGIPTSLGFLKNLTVIHLYLNYLGAKIPPSLGNLTSLLELNLWSNKLTGGIPRELGNLTQLQSLKLDDNELSGELPPELGKLSNLREITLTSNKLSGKLPKEYAQLRNLLSFELGGNYLSGPIPKFIANWVDLTSLILMGNNFEGKLPPAIFNMKNLQYLMITDLSSPSFEFPHSANLTNIYSLILRNCSVTGVIPTYFGNWSWLKYLDLSFNSLTGGIPDSFQNLSLSEMFLTENMLSGTVPGWIFKQVQKGDLSYNNFTFRGPTEKHSNQTRKLGFNNSGNGSPDHQEINIKPANRDTIYQIMDEKCDGKKSKYHSLFINAGGEETIIGKNHYNADDKTSNFYVNPANNWAYSCSGDFPWSTENPKDYIKNMTCGVSIPEAPLYAKSRLCPQSLTYYGFCLHNGNYTVKLHFAETVYTNQDDHSSTGKRVFDIYIQGKLALKDFNLKEKAGGPYKICTENFTANVHDNLLEIRLFWAGKGSLYSAPSLSGPLISAISVTPDFKIGRLSKKEIAGIIIASVSALLLLLAFMWRMGWLGDRELRVTCVELRGKSYSLKQIIDATRNFSTKTEIGVGRFGTVYKADLGDQIVAVKKLSPQARHVIDQIGTELYVQEKPLKHNNLVQLLGCCSKGDLHLLIYEHMENGSLQRALFDQDSKVQLDWPKRIIICLGIAKGLKYLHEGNPNHKIVHRNIKPSNVLLDGSLNAKIADLGLAKIYDEEDPYKFIREKGTAVYMAPEYAMRKAITDKVDVFSFGILLLEIVSGQTNAKYEENKETVFLLDTAIVLQTKGKIMELVDKKLSSYNWQQAHKILGLAIQCVDQSPTLRPTMSHAIPFFEIFL
ncbi:LRR receptor-like kinase [Melia azedarach]|uniref:LRR receptor-like kinase n=1 Tax=Melia azedarach TaxID=155640 RepID=A0ACC1WY62_MELAZ|nr:LRR receptor-like kinase [Melia azedarach]